MLNKEIFKTEKVDLLNNEKTEIVAFNCDMEDKIRQSGKPGRRLQIAGLDNEVVTVLLQRA